jgi:tetratricopeptide (TPR) repeat protein
VSGFRLTLCALAVGALTGCATTRGPVSASGKAIPPAALSNAVQRVETEQIPEPLRPYFVAMYAEGRENQALHAMRGGLEALRTGHLEWAERALGLAVEDVDSLVGGEAEARRAQRKFSREQEKWFKGEAYERSALFVYRGLAYLIRHDFGNAAACFKRAQLYDITSDDAAGFAGDWYSAEWLLALASLKQGFVADAAAALKRTEDFATRPATVTPPTPNINVLIVVETGMGPIKYRTGPYGEMMRYRPAPSEVRTVEIAPPGAAVLPAESLWVQATTRGRRQVDAILAGKARFKEGTETAAVGLAIGAAVAANHSRNDTAAGVLAGLALLSAGLSAATTPEADVRMWNNLPDTIYLAGLTLPPGATTVTVTGRNAAGQVIKTQELKPVIYKDNPLAVILVRL